MPRVYDKDPYAILSVHPTATASQIKEAYRRLARKYHPDLNQDSRAAEKMKDINWAKDVLGDPYERSLYDAWRQATFRVNVPPRQNPPPPSSAGTAARNSPPRESPPSYANPPRNPPPQATYARPVQTPRAQGCSSGLIIWALITLLMTLFRSMGSSSRPIVIANSATRTAQYEHLILIMETFDATPGTFPLRTTTPNAVVMTLFPVSPTVAVLRDEFGHEDIRARIVPGSQEWEWIHQYFPSLTTEEGLSEEVTFVFWDQTQRAIVIETRQSGVYIISTYGGQITAGHYGENSSTATPEAVPTPSP